MTDKKKTETVTLSEINYDAWETSGDTITVDTTTPLTAFGTDVITVTQEDLDKITQGSSGTSQLDLFPDALLNESVTVTINTNLDDE